MSDSPDFPKRKFSPYLDVPGFEQSEPVDLTRLLGDISDVELEIGFGKGRFLLERAQQQKETVLLGIETRRKWVALVEERAKKRGIKNAIVRFGDARQIVCRMEPERCLKNVFVNFPDPWWKARHANRMVVTSQLGRSLLRLMDKDAQLFVQTDVDFRAQAYQDELLKVPELKPVGDENGRVEANPFGARSLREVRCEELGLPVYRLLFKRV